MADGICDICNRRPASHTIELIRGGRRVSLELCNIDYAGLRQRQAMSPFESLFSGVSFPDTLWTNSLGVPSAEAPVSAQRESTSIEDYLSEHAQELIQKAAEVAVNFGRSEVDTEHMLYALADSGVVEEILHQFKIRPEYLKTYIKDNAPKGRPSSRPPTQISVSPRLKSVLQGAFGIARELGHGYIGPEHLLVALAGEDEGLARDVLQKYGLTPEALRQQAVKVVGRGAQEGRVEARSTTPELDKYSRDLTALARQDKLDPVIGRTKEIETTIEIVARRTKNNPALIGEPGVGKTAIVEGLAQRILSGKVPEVLKGKRVVEININSIVAGSKYRGEFEERIKAVLDEIIAHQEELVVFVDELHAIVGAGQAGGEGGLDVSNVLKPALSRGELHLIGATTLNEYQRYIERDAALERRFQPVMVGEPNQEQTIEILRGLRDRYEAHHKVKITDEAIVAAAELSDRYITGRFLPDKAIDLIDQAASRVRIGSDTFTHDMADLNGKIARTQRELEYAKHHRQYDAARRQEEELDRYKEEKDRRTGRWYKERGTTSNEVRVEHVAQVVSNLTGIPVSELTEEERSRLLRLEKRLHERVIGQDEAVKAVADAIRASRAGLVEGKRPIATFLFLGPTGVGKTELARALAWVVFGDEDAIIRLDMSEYMERHTVSRLIGAPPGYIGYEEGGQLTERVRRRPYSVILLDEIEKAHSDVHNLLLQVFDAGRLTDGKGRLVDFTNTIIITTSNLGSHLIQQDLAQPDADKKSYEELKNSLMQVIREYFRPEFINRIDEIIVFHALTREQITAIVGLHLERVKRLAHGQGIDLAFDDSVVKHLAEAGYVPEYGAREIRRLIKGEIENSLAREMLSGHIQEDSEVRVTYDEHEHGVVFHATAKPTEEAAEPKPQKAAPEASFRETLDDDRQNKQK